MATSGRKVDQAWIDRAHHLYVNERYSTRAVAKAMGSSPVTVLKYLGPLGVMRPPGPPATEPDDGAEWLTTARALYATGLGIPAVSRQVGVTTTRLWRALTRLGEIRSPQQARQAMGPYRRTAAKDPTQLTKGTWAAYRSRYRKFEVWCTGNNAAPMPAAPGTIAAYLQSLTEAGAPAGTVAGTAAAIRAVHREHGHPIPGDGDQRRAAADVGNPGT